jgi:mannose-6-phosphate isomerase-like protein (cupin superfamily)
MARISLLLILICSFFYPSTLAQLPSLPNINQEAPLDEAVGIPREAVVLAFRRMNLENIATLRMLEGGEYNVNIRHLENISVDNMVLLTHPDTIDVWIVQEGSGTVITGGEMVGNVHQGGIERFISVGDLMFIPAGLPHGIKETSAITWFNIRFPEHRN